MIEAGQLTDRLSSIKELPTFPTTALEVMRLASDTDSSAAELSKIISKDPSLATRILRVANSPFYGFARKISSIEWAVVALGFETLRETVLSLTLIDLFKGATLKHFDPRKFWKHAVDTAAVGRSIAREIKYRIPGEAYACGLLHDIGTLVLYRFFPEDFQEIGRLVYEENLQHSQAELMVTDTTHADVGAWLAEKWSFPAAFVEAVRYHHAPSNAEINPELTAIVHVANQITCSNGYSCSDLPIKFDVAAVQIIGIERLGISVKALADKYINENSESVVKVKVPISDIAFFDAAHPAASGDSQQASPENDEDTLKRFFRDAIKLLPSAERLVITLKLYEGLELRQVATVLGYDEARVAEYYTNAISVLQQMAERAILTNRMNQWKMKP